MTEKKLPPLALGAWSWGTGMAGGDQVFGNHYFEDDLRPVFDKAMEKDRPSGTQQPSTEKERPKESWAIS